MMKISFNLINVNLRFKMRKVSYIENFALNVSEIKLHNNSFTKILLHL